MDSCSINWITQFLTILSEIPATFEYIDLRFRPGAPGIGFMQALSGIFCRFVALPVLLRAATPQEASCYVVVTPLYGGNYSQVGSHAD